MFRSRDILSLPVCSLGYVTWLQGVIEYIFDGKIEVVIYYKVYLITWSSDINENW